MPDANRAYQKAMTLAALTGLKLTFGPALLATSRKTPGAANWVAAAIGEMVLDKVGILPSRSNPALLVPRAVTGAWVAHESLERDGVHDPLGAAAGAVVAAGVASVVPAARVTLNKVFGLPDWFLGLAEDVLALQLGTEATGLTLDEVGQAARDSVEELYGKAQPALESVGIGG